MIRHTHTHSSCNTQFLEARERVKCGRGKRDQGVEGEVTG
jgi:hypothetical protein